MNFVVGLQHGRKSLFMSIITAIKERPFLKAKCLVTSSLHPVQNSYSYSIVNKITAKQLRLFFSVASQKWLKVSKGTAPTDRWVSSARLEGEAEVLSFKSLLQLMNSSQCCLCQCTVCICCSFDLQFRLVYTTCTLSVGLWHIWGDCSM